MNEMYWFRGKDSTKKWVKGYLAAYIIIMIGMTGITIDPETIGQYTTIDDKNKTPIYEGDICRYKNAIGTEIICTINWSKGCYCCRTITPRHLNKNYPAIDIVLHECNGDIEVIGNIYDNPELL